MCAGDGLDGCSKRRHVGFVQALEHGVTEQQRCRGLECAIRCLEAHSKVTAVRRRCDAGTKVLDPVAKRRRVLSSAGDAAHESVDRDAEWSDRRLVDFGRTARHGDHVER